MNDLDKALDRYAKEQFTDRDVTGCTGLSVRGWRELIKTRAVRTITENRGRGRVRLCDATVLKRAAAIGALNQAGLSLAVAGHIAYSLPFHTLLYAICDPRTVLPQPATEVDPKYRPPHPIERPKVDWFDPVKPAVAEPKTDWLIEIFDGRFVAAVYNGSDEPAIFGDLREDGTRFVAWFPYHGRGQFTGGTIGEIARELLPHRFIDFVAEWEDPAEWVKELKALNYEFEKHDTDADPLCMTAAASARSPVFKTTINVTLAVRKAVRRYLGIEPTDPALELDSRHES